MKRFAQWKWLLEAILAATVSSILTLLVSLPFPPLIKYGSGTFLIAFIAYHWFDVYREWRRLPPQKKGHSIVIRFSWPLIIAVAFGLVSLALLMSTLLAR